MFDNPNSAPNIDDVFNTIEQFLDRYGNDDSILDVSELDGYFTALACSPFTIMPSEWLPCIWGSAENNPAWENLDEFREFSTLIMFFYNSVMESINQGDHEALFYNREVKGKTYMIVDEWCHGFLRGVNLWGPLPAADAIVVNNSIKPMQLFATEEGFEKLDKLSDTEIEELQHAIEPSARSLYHYFLKQRRPNSTQTQRRSPKTGRNDPCPCGSGKKYKQCCLH